jgi:ubiquinone/menaquinone biosynthesis C-methylase UbiE
MPPGGAPMNGLNSAGRPPRYAVDMTLNHAAVDMRTGADEPDIAGAAGIPRYLVEHYSWAYLDPAAIAFFDRGWVVNLILWGQFRRLSRIAFGALGDAPLTGSTLQVACVYGDLTPRLAGRIGPGAALEVIDVAPQQLANLRRKLKPDPRISLRLTNSTDLGGADGRFDRALLFFLLHEQPEAVRRATLSEVVRVIKPGGRVVIVDYHRPAALNPLRYLMRPLLRRLEPYALDLWRQELDAWLPPTLVSSARHDRYFGGLYQVLVLTVEPIR